MNTALIPLVLDTRKMTPLFNNWIQHAEILCLPRGTRGHSRPFQTTQIQILPYESLQRRSIVLSRGMVLDPVQLSWDIKKIVKAHALPPHETLKQIKISPHIRMLLPQHRLITTHTNNKRQFKRQVLFNVFADKDNIRLSNFLQDKYLFQRIKERCLEEGLQSNYLSKYLTHLQEARQIILPLLNNTDHYLCQMYLNRHDIVIPQIDSYLHDMDQGLTSEQYPYSLGISGLTSGSALPSSTIQHRIGFFKPFETSFEKNSHLQEQMPLELAQKVRYPWQEAYNNGETITLLWLNLPRLRHHIRHNEIKELALANISALDNLPQIHFIEKWQNQKPLLKKMVGWNQNTTHYQKFYQLPEMTKYIISYLEEQLETPINWISTDREILNR